MKKVKIYRGLPGAGKDHHIKTTFADVKHIVCSADDYFVGVDGEYRYDYGQIGEAQKSCMRKFLLACVNEEAPYIVVNNTNTWTWELSPYVSVGEAMGYEVDITQINAPVDVCVARNVHNVPATKILSMAAAMATQTLPLNWYVTQINASA